MRLDHQNTNNLIRFHSMSNLHVDQRLALVPLHGDSRGLLDGTGETFLGLFYGHICMWAVSISFPVGKISGLVVWLKRQQIEIIKMGALSGIWHVCLFTIKDVRFHTVVHKGPYLMIYSKQQLCLDRLLIKWIPLL